MTDDLEAVRGWYAEYQYTEMNGYVRFEARRVTILTLGYNVKLQTQSE